jgi:cobalt-zinc-cadmium efflux system outer membrane protein
MAIASVQAAPVPASPALPAVLTLDDAVRVARERGLDVLTAEAAVASAQGDVHAAGAVPNPVLSGSYGRSFTYGRCVDAAGNPASCGVIPTPLYGIGIADQGALFDAVTGKRGLRLRAAEAALEAARSSRDNAVRTLVVQVKQAFLQALIAREGLRFAREVAQASDRTAELTRVRYEAGAISETDLARIEVAKLEADQAADAAAQAHRDARVALAFLLGVRGPVPDYDVEGPALLRATAPPSLTAATSEGLLVRARKARPDLAAAAEQRARAEGALALARRQRFPDVTLSLNYTQQGTTNSAVTPPTFVGGISLPLPIFYRQRGEIEKAQADVDTQAVQEARVEAQVVSDVETGLADYGAADRLARRMQEGLLERARRARDLVAVQYQKGAASLIDYLDAQRTYIATNLEYLQDLASFWGAVFRLEQAVGEELR